MGDPVAFTPSLAERVGGKEMHSRQPIHWSLVKDWLICLVCCSKPWRTGLLSWPARMQRRRRHRRPASLQRALATRLGGQGVQSPAGEMPPTCTVPHIFLFLDLGNLLFSRGKPGGKFAWLALRTAVLNSKGAKCFHAYGEKAEDDRAVIA